VSAPRNSEEKILHGVRGLFAEYERAKITERFRLGKVRKIKEGHVLVSEAPFGYKYIPKQGSEHGYFVIDDIEAIVVKSIFEWVANEHLTLRQIVRRLQEMRIKPRKSSRGVWNTSTLSTLLRNGAYIGEAHWNASYSVVPERPLKTAAYRKVKKTSRRNRPREDWYVVAVPAIIDKQLFERARAQLDANLALSKRNKRNEYLLAGKIRCVCGRTRGGEGVLNGKHLYYRCSDRVLRYPLPRVCQERGINARIADELVWNALAELMTSPGLMLSHLEDWINSERKELGNSVVNSETLAKERTSLTQQVDRYSKAYAAGLHNIEELRGYIEPLKRRIAEIENVLSDIQSGKGQRRIEMLKREVLEKYVNEVGPALKNLSFSQKRAIVIHAVEKIVGTPRELRVSGFIPVEDHVKFETSHRHGANAPRHAPGVPFEFTIGLPAPLTRGVDYGFLPSRNISQRARGL
jgi:site-specific DNA recombinase